MLTSFVQSILDFNEDEQVKLAIAQSLRGSTVSDSEEDDDDGSSTVAGKRLLVVLAVSTMRSERPGLCDKRACFTCVGVKLTSTTY